MDEVIKTFLEMQNLDLEIFRLQKLLKDLPERKKMLEVSYQEKARAGEELAEEMKKNQLQRKEKELELESKEGEIKKYRTQLYQIKTNKEYRALQDEIGSLSADRSLLEDAILRLLEETDQLKAKIAAEKKVLEEEKKRLESESGKIENEISEAERRRAELLEKKKNISPAVKSYFLARYERISQAREGFALAKVLGSACGGCNMKVPPQVINEIKKSQDLIICENCARILYLEEERGG